MDIEYFPEAKVVLIHGHEPKVVACLRTQLVDLAAGRCRSIAIHALPGFRSVGGCQLFAEADVSNSGVRADPLPPVFRCRLTLRTWQAIEGLLEPFSDGSYFAASQQFLDEHSGDRLIISGGRSW